ncbi:hypothetical protein EMIHUDRAFT_95865 [Emiliania huxleyi CCMP1516]|uniref:Macrocin O-methyltransferase n=2 Tax=Emiliania huxleyi TaxID=2903 RepID=A0A0D3J3F6_EMIH1|nr:hypothetical protein EMIHUDRAFT_95865 [Emiliania huxleyi CCMP1516]EOD18041.1 hypothetical protein EMIHUDRAFT_95865 [Emiliania huxleyi CCMP1516]|eukprot:XP_005770470.1 hypothetical protein EMIHUDRAFT_95865 [Emiliania huxleyi CCMP1516]
MNSLAFVATLLSTLPSVKGFDVSKCISSKVARGYAKFAAKSFCIDQRVQRCTDHLAATVNVTDPLITQNTMLREGRLTTVLDTWSNVLARGLEADSFQGLPKARNEDKNKGRMDKEGSYNDYGGVETVKHLFRKAGFAVAGPSKAAVGADLTVRFLKGWFSETIKGAPIEKVALLRLDGDMYSSTMDTIRPLYPKLAPSGYLLVDDYGHWEPCRRAIDDYFTLEQGWLPSFQWSDYTGVWMQKPRVAPVAPPSTSSS